MRIHRLPGPNMEVGLVPHKSFLRNEVSIRSSFPCMILVNLVVALRISLTQPPTTRPTALVNSDAPDSKLPAANHTLPVPDSAHSERGELINENGCWSLGSGLGDDDSSKRGAAKKEQVNSSAPLNSPRHLSLAADSGIGTGRDRINRHQLLGPHKLCNAPSLPRGTHRPCLSLTPPRTCQHSSRNRSEQHLMPLR